MKETWVRSLSWEDPLEKEMEPTLVLLSGKFHGWRSLAGYSPWGRKELDMNEQLHFLGDWVDFDVEREMEIDRLEQEIPQRRTVNHWVTSNQCQLLCQALYQDVLCHMALPWSVGNQTDR